MKRLGLALAFLAAFSFEALAQVGGLSFPGPGPRVTSGAAYTGPGDSVSGSQSFYSCARAFNLTYATAHSNLCKVVDTATGLTNCTIVAQTNGYANLTATSCPGSTTLATFCGSGCSVTTAYDQSGALACGGSACDATQGTLANMPTLTLNALNGLPCMTNASGSLSLLTPGLTVAQSLGFSAVAKQLAASTNFGTIIGAQSGSPSLFFGSSANTISIYAGSPQPATAADLSFHAINSTLNGASSSITVDSTLTSGLSVGTGAYSASVNQLMGNVFAPGDMTVCEAGVWNASLTSSTQATLNTNQHSSSNGYNF